MNSSCMGPQTSISPPFISTQVRNCRLSMKLKFYNAYRLRAVVSPEEPQPSHFQHYPPCQSTTQGATWYPQPENLLGGWQIPPYIARRRDEPRLRYFFGRMEGEAESVWKGLPNAVHRLRTRGLSIYDPPHSWPDSASVVDGVRRDREWRDSGGGSSSVNNCVSTLLIRTFIGHRHKAVWGSSALNG